MSLSTFPSRSRQIHLDFHTSPAIPAVGALFDPEEFGDSLLAAHVDSVTLFAKCHHGHLYYNTSHEARHPTMDEGLLEKQVEALHQRGIRCPIYISVQCDEFAAIQHPEWRAIAEDGTQVGRKPLSTGNFNWRILDMSSPYLEYLEQQVAEVMTAFKPVDGIFFDMCWDQVSLSRWAIQGMEAAGLNPENCEDRTLYSNQVSLRYMGRLCDLIETFQADVPIWFNSRKMTNAKLEKRFLRHVEIEALPSGQWGYAYFPRWVRYAKTLELPMIGMTGRFHKSWADFGGLRTKDSLLYDCAQALAHGAGCSVGDQLHPSGKMDRGVYRLIGEVYAHVEKCEPWCRETVSTKEIAVLTPPGGEKFVGGTSDAAATANCNGIVTALSELRYQFVMIEPDETWESYPVTYLPESLEISDELESRVQSYVNQGGKVLREVNVGEPLPFKTCYLRFEEGSQGSLEETDHVFYEQGIQMFPESGDAVLARIVEPYFERNWDRFCSHAQTPNQLEVSPWVAGVIRGNQALFALPVSRAYAEHGNLPCRQLLEAALDRFLPIRAVRVEGPSYVETLCNTRGTQTMLHFLSYIPRKKTPSMEMVENAVAARNLKVKVAHASPAKSVRRVVEPGEIQFHQEGGVVSFCLDWVEGHEIIVIE